ncbi:helix-turn-helix domain-containing protein [Weissella cibaria]|uniref:helix-turn-helix domain-containing protein n=1 Tax=Weissella cibaria TaxID=137591 RepID=UPI001898B91B|nr:helix-turn-helix domain-containing protein [Weissella cibaria]
MNDEFKGVNYYLFIPAKIAHDERLKSDAKMIYGEIAALANVYGRVFISNAKLADRYNIRKETVSRHISQLESFEYISTELKYKEGTKLVEGRLITVVPIDGTVNTPMTEQSTPY